MQSNLPKNPQRPSIYSVIPAGAQRSGGPLAFRYCRCLFSAGICLLLAPPISHAQTASREIHILATADLQPVLPALAELFTHTTNIKLTVRYGTSATLADQLIAGDPGDLFLATDYSFPEKIVAANLADSPAPIPYARGTLVLWARKDSPLQPLTQNTLLDPRVQSVAIADPDHIPYGRATVAALTRMKLYDQLKPRLIVADDLAQTAQLVESGKAQLGFLSLIAVSTPHAKQLGSFIRMPPSAYPPVRECAVVIKNSAHNADAHVFLDWLRSSPIQQTLPAYGLDPLQ
jgi:molybdate transport system substrate-binding protein